MIRPVCIFRHSSARHPPCPCVHICRTACVLNGVTPSLEHGYATLLDCLACTGARLCPSLTWPGRQVMHACSFCNIQEAMLDQLWAHVKSSRFQGTGGSRSIKQCTVLASLWQFNFNLVGLSSRDRAPPGPSIVVLGDLYACMHACSVCLICSNITSTLHASCKFAFSGGGGVPVNPATT
jgi:hypothetical protein